MEIKNALIIDDEIDICLLLRNFLNRKNKKAEYSTTLEDGINKFREHQPELVILDNNLPDGKGIDLIKDLKRAVKKGHPLHIIVISAMSNLKSKALAYGADYFMEKPISFSKLNDILLQ
jgi:DNA-binding response OmpR family regulator